MGPTGGPHPHPYSIVGGPIRGGGGGVYRGIPLIGTREVPVAHSDPMWGRSVQWAYSGGSSYPPRGYPISHEVVVANLQQQERILTGFPKQLATSKKKGILDLKKTREDTPCLPRTKNAEV